MATERRRSILCTSADRPGRSQTRTHRGYHQDQSPDRMFHDFLLTCGSPGSGNPEWLNYTPLVKEKVEEMQEEKEKSVSS